MYVAMYVKGVLFDAPPICHPITPFPPTAPIQ